MDYNKYWLYDQSIQSHRGEDLLKKLYIFSNKDTPVGVNACNARMELCKARKGTLGIEVDDEEVNTKIVLNVLVE